MFTRLLDGFIGAFSPESALKRAHARKLLQRGYSAAEPSRLNANKRPKNQSADQELSGPFGANTMRAWARMLVRDNAWAWGVVDTYVNNVIGKGINVQSAFETPEGEDVENVNDERDRVWSQWCEVCEVNGQYTFSEIQQMIMREIVEAGEVLIRMITVPQKYKGIFRPVPFAIELIEADRLAEDRDRLAGHRAANGSEIVRGVELDEEGKPIAYWIYPTHPNDIRKVAPTPVRIDASEIIHLYNRERVGQTRGITIFAPVVSWMRDLGLYVENELQASAVASCFTVAIRSDSPTTGLLPPTTISQETNDENGNRYDYLEPGMIMRLRTNESIESANPGRPNSGADPWIRLMLRGIAVGTGLSYETVARDYSQTNYSSNRASQLEDRRRFRRWQRYLIDHFNKPIWNRLCMAAAQADLQSFPTASELLANPEKAAPCEHMPPAWEWVDPGVEQSSSEASINAFQTTYAEELGAKGLNYRHVFYQRAKEQELLKKLKLAPGDESGAPGAPPSPGGEGSAPPPAQTSPGAESPAGSPAEAPAEVQVQDTALNGAQVSSLVGVLEQVAAGVLPQDTAKAVIAAAFPTLDKSLIEQIVAPIQVIKPDSPAAPEGEEPKKKDEASSDMASLPRCTGTGNDCNCKICRDKQSRAFCGTGKDGGLDNSCTPANAGKSMSEVTGDSGKSGKSGTPGSSRVLFEVAPDPDNKELAERFSSMSPDDQIEASQNVSRKVMPKVLAALGLENVTIQDQIGGFEDLSSPSFAAVVHDPADIPQIMSLTKATGFALSQKSMMVTSSQPFEGGEKGGFITIELPEGADQDTIHGVYQALRSKLGDRVGGHTTVDGQMLIVDTQPNSREFADEIDKALNGAYEMKHAEGYYAWPQKEDYNYASETGTSDLVGKRGSLDRAGIRSIQGEASAELEKELQARSGKSKAADSGSDEGGKLSTPSGVIGSTTPEDYKGTPRYNGNKKGAPKDAVSVVGVHYGFSEGVVLNSAAYGKGLKGAEKSRIAQSDDKRIGQRIYFYVDEGEGVFPEAGVGPHRKQVQMDNLYHVKKDPTLWRKAGGDANKAESLILDAGYDGYYVESGFGNQGVAVLLGPRKVPIKWTRREKEEAKRWLERAFCGTGKDGGLDNSCSPANAGKSMAEVAGKAASSGKTVKPPQAKADLGKQDSGGRLIDTQAIHYDSDQKEWTPERKVLHEKIQTDRMEGKTPVDQPVAILFGGGGGAGKSTIAHSGSLGDLSNFVMIDSDAIKGDLPEYQEMLKNKDNTAAAVAHEESSYLAKQLHDRAGKGKFNVVLDGTGDSGINSVMKKVEKMREHGAKVVAHYVTVDTETAMQRNRERYKKTGRYVPEEMLRWAHKNVSEIVPELIKRKAFDEFTLWDTNDTSKRIAYLDKGSLVIEDEKAWKRFLGKAKE